MITGLPSKNPLVGYLHLCVVPFRCPAGRRLPRRWADASRKEVFQPHLPVRLPCYDLAPVTGLTLGRSLRSRPSGTPGSHGLTGGVYKARERIHRAMADSLVIAHQPWPGNVFTAPWLMRDY